MPFRAFAWLPAQSRSEGLRSEVIRGRGTEDTSSRGPAREEDPWHKSTPDGLIKPGVAMGHDDPGDSLQERLDAMGAPGMHPAEIHECPERTNHLGVTRQERPPEELLYGPAINQIVRSGEKWWAHNGEYSTEVSFCPWCGADL